MKGWRSSTRISLGIFLLILIAIAYTIRGEWFLFHRDSIVIIPVQNRFEEHANIETDDEVIAVMESLHLQHGSRSEHAPEDLEALMITALLRQDIYFSRRWIMTVTGLFAELIRFKMAVQLTDEALSICLRLRWILPRINQIVGPCSKIARQGGSIQKKTKSNVQTGQFLQIVSPNPGIAKLAHRYLRNPYDADVLFDLAAQLATNGFGEHAGLLQEELLQIDPIAAARLESRIAGLQRTGL